MTELQGWCASRLEPLRQAFARSFEGDLPAAEQELGAALCVIIDGAVAAELWGGAAAPGQPWTEQTIALMMSATKALPAIAIHQLAERGWMRLDAPIVDYWPEFGGNGKQDATVAQALDHSAGVPLVGDQVRNLRFNPSDWRKAIEEAPLRFPPGTVHAYHAVTQGYILCELIERVSGEPAADFLRENVLKPTAAEISIGLSAELAGRAAEWSPLSDINEAAKAQPDAPAVKAITQMMNPIDFNDAEFRSAFVPSANGFGTAGGLARLYAALLEPDLLLGAAQMREMTDQSWAGAEHYSGVEWHLGLGLMLSNDFAYMGPNRRSFGHAGSGGAIGFADPDARLAFAYLPNRSYPAPGTGKRVTKLVDALYGALA